jgi:hypothetical protein
LAKKVRPKVGRPTGRKPLLNLRVEQSLHNRLGKAAAVAGHSISEETVRRLNFSFRDEDDFGGPDLRFFAVLIQSTFAHNASQAAREKEGGLDWTPAQWLKDQDCYRSGCLALMVTLFDYMPKATLEQFHLTIEALRARLTDVLIRKDQLELVEKKDDK